MVFVSRSSLARQWALRYWFLRLFDHCYCAIFIVVIDRAVHTNGTHCTACHLLCLSNALQSPVRTRTPMMYLDFRLDPGAHLEQAIPQGWTGLVYTLAGNGHFGTCMFIVSSLQVVVLPDNFKLFPTSILVKRFFWYRGLTGGHVVA